MAIETIDVTPTWEEILPTWLFIARQAYPAAWREHGQGKKPSPGTKKQIENFEAEMLNMARAADAWVAHCKESADGQH